MQTSLLHTSLYRWYDHNHRVLPWRDTDDPYAIWISEIILQQTRVVQGMDYFLRFMQRFPDVRTLAEAGEDEVLRYWQGLGYYSRARNLHKAAKMMVEQGRLPFPQTFEQIRLLPGVGDYTAGAIASFAYNLPYPAMDGNVYRVVARLFDCDMPFDTTQGKKHFHQLIEQILDKANARLFNSAVMEFGALYCTPSLSQSEDEESRCTRCPLQVHCLAYQHHTAELLPVRKPRPQLRDRYLNYYIYISRAHEGEEPQTLIQQRTGKDIWQHLYEFPLRETQDALLSPDSPAFNSSLSDRLIGKKGVVYRDFTHVLSHQRLHARFFYLLVETLPTIPDTLTIPWSRLDDYAFSRLTLNALSALTHA
ncbi:MAG: A/G-specific adenine glycosylase [Paludibacteraceae bacterium]